MKPVVPLVGPLERTLYLQSLPAFDGLRSSQLARLAQLMDEEYIDAGAVLYRQGEPPAKLHFLVDGTVANLRDGRCIYVQEAPAMTGLNGLLGGRGASLEVKAATALTTLSIAGDAFLDLIEDHYDVFLHFRALYAARVESLQKRTGLFHTDHGGTKFADAPEPGGVVESLLCLRRSVVFADAPVAALVQMIHDDSLVRFAGGQTIWSEGARGTYLLVVVHGEVRCSARDESTEFHAGPGYVLGADATFGSLPYAYTATALTPVAALRVDAAVITDVMEDHFEFALETLAHFAREEIRLLERSAGDDAAAA